MLNPFTGQMMPASSPSPYDKGYYTTEAALNTALPVGEAGWFCNIGATDTVWIWDADAVTPAWIDTKTKGLQIGETSATAYRGDRGKTAYNHSQAAHAPSNAQKNSDIPAPADITAGTRNVVLADNGTVFTNAGATEDIILQLDTRANLGNKFAIGVVNEIGGGGMDQYTKLMLHFNNNANDSSTGNHTPTASNMTYSNSAGEFKFGYSGVFNGTTSKITYPTSTAFNLGNSDFTLGLHAKFNSVTGTRVLIDQFGSANASWTFYLNGTSLLFTYTTDGIIANSISRAFAWVTVTTGVWYHIQLVRNGNSLKCYVDQVQIGATETITGAIYSSTNALEIGSENGTPYFSGKMDELRIDVGIARAAIEQTVEYTGGAITIKPATGEQLPGTASVSNSIQSLAKKDYIKLRTTDTGIIAESVYPAAANWVDLLD